jgi:hypothetical protein
MNENELGTLTEVEGSVPLTSLSMGKSKSCLC